MPLALLVCLAQMPEMPAMIAQYGWPGIVLLVVIRWLQRIEKACDRMEHSNRGLTKSLWTDLASRPYSSNFIKAEADRELARMEATRGKD